MSYFKKQVDDVLSKNLQDLAIHLSESLEIDLDTVISSIEKFDLSSPKPKKKLVISKKRVSIEKEDKNEEPKKKVPTVKKIVVPKKKTVVEEKEETDDEEEKEVQKKKPMSNGDDQKTSFLSAKTNGKTSAKSKINSIVSGKGVGILKKKAFTLNITKIGDHYVEQEHRICIDTDTYEGYGVLDKDNKTVKPLSLENERFLDAHNYNIREYDPKKKQLAKQKQITSKKTETKKDKEKEDDDDEEELSDLDVDDETNEETLEEVEDNENEEEAEDIEE
jgi:hypothetical protein